MSSAKPAYKRILLKLSGEALMGDDAFGINRATIVRMAEEPVTAYRGGVKGYGATKPSAGKKIDPDAPAVAGYKGYLASRHDAALAGDSLERRPLELDGTELAASTR